MQICSVSLKGRYGWKTITIDEFLRSYVMAERLSKVADPELAACVNEFGQLIEPEKAVKLLEELEADRCISARDLSLFMKVYPYESKFRILVEQRIDKMMRLCQENG